MSHSITIVKPKRPTLHLFKDPATEAQAAKPKWKGAPAELREALHSIKVDGLTLKLRRGFLAQCVVTDHSLSFEARVFGSYVGCAAVPKPSDNFLKFTVRLCRFTPEHVTQRLGFDVTAALQELTEARILKIEPNKFGGHSLRFRSGFIIRELKSEHEWRVAKGRV